TAVEQGGSSAVVDTVYMDNVDGGRRATQHLAHRGHRRIGFLGLHPATGPTTFYTWSVLREQGWREAMRDLGEPVARMVFQPADTPGGFEREVEAAKAAAAPILTRRDITAVVCANDHAAVGLLAVLRDEEV